MSIVRNVAERTFGFGFVPDESSHHFLVTIPPGNRQDVLISEHYSYDPDKGSGSITFAIGQDDGKLRGRSRPGRHEG